MVGTPRWIQPIDFSFHFFLSFFLFGFGFFLAFLFSLVLCLSFVSWLMDTSRSIWSTYTNQDSPPCPQGSGHSDTFPPPAAKPEEDPKENPNQHKVKWYTPAITPISTIFTVFTVFTVLYTLIYIIIYSRCSRCAVYEHWAEHWCITPTQPPTPLWMAAPPCGPCNWCISMSGSSIDSFIVWKGH